MSEQVRESLSALMDGEAEELELRRLLTAEQDDQVDQLWSRYHLVREFMQNDQQTIAYRHLDISKKLRLAVSEEPAISETVTVRESVNSAAWWRPAAGFAVAASVAVAVVFSVQALNSAGPVMNSSFAGSGGAGQPAVASRVYPMTVSTQATGGLQASGEVVNYANTALPGGVAASRAAADLEAQNRLQKYMLRHTESAALNNGQGMISFARVASFEAE